jgi:ABC-type uncharacterized transport system substrate-binding protein
MKNITYKNWQMILSRAICLFSILVIMSACVEPSTTKVVKPVVQKSPVTDNSVKESLLIIRLDGKNFEEVVSGLSEELSEELVLHELIVNKNTSESEIAQKMREVSPKLVVLMDNISVFLYTNYQKSLPDTTNATPSVAVMASFMDIAIKGLKNATGIFYEVPLVTSVVNLRAILATGTFAKIGVVHRNFMLPAINFNRKYCAKENIDLITYLLADQDATVTKLNDALSQLDKKVDALWVPNDNKLINAQMLKSIWIPFAKEFRKPIITGVEILVEPKFQFGTFAVIPDPVQLGIQAAEIVFDAMDNDWEVEAGEVQPPRSVYKIINLEQAERLFSVNKEKLQNMVDKILTEL